MNGRSHREACVNAQAPYITRCLSSESFGTTLRKQLPCSLTQHRSGSNRCLGLRCRARTQVFGLAGGQAKIGDSHQQDSCVDLQRRLHACQIRNPAQQRRPHHQPCTAQHLLLVVGRLKYAKGATELPCASSRSAKPVTCGMQYLTNAAQVTP